MRTACFIEELFPSIHPHFVIRCGRSNPVPQSGGGVCNMLCVVEWLEGRHDEEKTSSNQVGEHLKNRVPCFYSVMRKKCFCNGYDRQ